MRQNDANKTPTPTLSHVRHSQSFHKIDSFLEPVLNILILCNLIVAWGEGVIKRGLVFYIKSIDLEEVFKSWGEHDSSK